MQENRNNKRGRPFGSVKGEPRIVHMWRRNIEAVDAWSARFAPHFSRPQAIDYLLSIAFKHLPRRPLKPDDSKKDR